ncbi:ABC transporter permease [Pantoea sp. App145]|uniref:ABC transporter permease n=1 Tax=Pantoea sp. App145 TaxID=3071567 RepID=UPI003A80627B
MKRSIVHLSWSLPGFAVLITIWWLVTNASDGMATLFSPEQAFISLWVMFHQGLLIQNIIVSLSRVAIGLGFALLIGVPIGLMIGCSAVLERITMPAMQFLRMVSPISWMPIAVMMLGIGDHSIWFLLAFAAVWPIILNTASGVKQLPPGWTMLAKSLSATPVEWLWYIVVPAVRIHVLTGIRLSIGVLWIVLVPCEMLGVNSGLGYAILDARDRLDYPALMAVIITIGFIGFVMDWLSRILISHTRH